MKQCSNCKIFKELSSFSWRRDTNKPRSTCKICRSSYSKKYRNENLNACQERELSYARNHREKKKINAQKWYANNKEKAKQTQKNRRLIIRTRERYRYHNDRQYKLAKLLRTRLSNAVTNKSKATEKLLGIPIPWFKEYIEMLWKPGMTWNNYGSEWHIDHIYPLSKVNLSCPSQLQSVTHFTNLQPLWASENLQKGSKVWQK